MIEAVRQNKDVCFSLTCVYVVIQFFSQFNFYFPLFLGMEMYDNEFTIKENKN